MLYRGMDRTALDAAYNNSAAIPDTPRFRADWAARSAAFYERHREMLERALSDLERQLADLDARDRAAGSP